MVYFDTNKQENNPYFITNYSKYEHQQTFVTTYWYMVSDV